MSSEGSVGRGAGLILAAGIGLGLAHNALGLASRPPRGLAWLASPTTLGQLAGPEDDETGAGPEGRRDSMSAGGSSPKRAVGDPGAVATSPAGAGAGSTGGHARAGRAPATNPVVPAPVVARDPPRTESLPLIPERGRPVEIDLATAQSLFDAGAALFVDARDAAEFEAGHIPGAVRLTPNDALADPERVRALAPGARPIITYCEGGTCEASLDLARALVDAGYRRVLVYAGGFPEWAAAGHATERGGGGR